ncbi:MAG: glycosyltransferase [Crocinitomicaceae bacterium]|jgi:glycosyltransferase involved in cell wall biosynthesis|nr:glycosyltransferase [Crocinitomicaceae bacterium]MDP4761653.1 glycosyltransferase [Crocinitomicaceae bacterium]
MQKRNVLFLSSWYPNRIKPTHGNFVFQHAFASAKFNHVHLIYVCLDESLKHGQELVYSSEPFPTSIIYLSKSRIPILGSIWNYLRILLCYLRYLKKLKKDGFHPDIVHANVVYPIGFVAWLVKKIHRIPYVITEHWTVYHHSAQAKLGFWQRKMTIFSANRAASILPVSENLAKAMRSFGINSEMKVVYNAIDTDVFVPKEKIINEGIQLVHVSSLDPIQKNPLLLLEAFQQMLLTHPKAKLNIISDGDYHFFQPEIQRLGISGNVIFHGIKDAKGIAQLLQQANLFVLTSRFENLPCVLIEARSCGVPVVSTNVGGIDEIIQANDGVLVPSEDLGALVTAINQQIERLSSYQSDDMHKRASELFSYNAIGKEFTQIYESILTEHAS